MAKRWWFLSSGLAAIALITIPALAAEKAPPIDTAAIQQQIDSQFKLTKATADHSDIVTPGDVVLLQKDGLVMNSSMCPYAGSNSYNKGVLAANLANRAKDAAKNYAKSWALGKIGLGGGASVADAANNGCANRTFVAGEKFWISGITAKSDGILLSTLSDPYNNVRFYGEIKFPYVKGSVTQAADFVKAVTEVLTVVPAEGEASQPAQDAAPAPLPAPVPAPIQAIAPPPPPPDAPPPSIDLGQSKDQVIASSGQPLRVANLGAKTVFYYKDMKVIFTNGKVSNVE
ncbi:MAG: hypothetical protein WB424_15985 [Terracidiphilus sp.]|jgi:hypothetical protein